MVHQLAGRWRRPFRELATDELPDRGHGGGLELRTDHLALWAEIRRLPPRMRVTLVLRYVEDLTEEATARELGVSLGTVKSQTHHALKRLRAALPDLELTSCPSPSSATRSPPCPTPSRCRPRTWSASSARSGAHTGAGARP